MKKCLMVLWFLPLFFFTGSYIVAQNKIWTIEQANEWYTKQEWKAGCNFIPSNAINQLEMWQEETFDPKIIDKELSYAQNAGFNSMRVFLHNLVWLKDSTGFLDRIERYLSISAKHKISTMFVFFDDCWDGNPKLGKQPDPKPHVHNSGWVQCPGQEEVTDVSQFANLESYVKGILSHFKNDKRIILWDLYNEPGNSKHGDESIPLLKAAFKWAQSVRPSQPISVGVWLLNKESAKLNKIQIMNSDVITFHNYGDLNDMKSAIDSLKKYGKPLICTEYMRRPISNFKTHLPLLKEEKVWAYNWGLVSGKTQTIYPWDSWQKTYSSEPEIWFHDIFRGDGSAFDKSEVDLIEQVNRSK